MMTGSSVLELESVSKRYGDRRILKDTSLSVAQGDRILITGNNGVGKSTLLGICAGSIRPDSGKRVVQEPSKIRILSDRFGFYEQLSIVENFRFFNTLPSRDVLEPWGVYQAKDQRFGTLSNGEKTRALLALFLSDAPDLLLVDESLSFLDNDALTLFEEKLGAVGALLVTSHEPKRLESFVGRTLNL